MTKYYLLSALLLGGFLGWRLKPVPIQVPQGTQAEAKQEQVKVVTRTVIKTVKPDGTVVTEEVVKDLNKSKALVKTKAESLPKPDYRVGVQTGLDLRYTFTTGRRLVGNVWLDGSYKPSTKEFTLGVAVEF